MQESIYEMSETSKHILNISIREPLGQWNKGRKNTYILLSNAIGKRLPSATPSHWAHLEKDLAILLGVGLPFPFHIKTIKRLTRSVRLGPSPVSFLELLDLHSGTLLQGRSVALVVDDLSDLTSDELQWAVKHLENLQVKGYKIIRKNDSGELSLWPRNSQNLIKKGTAKSGTTSAELFH